MTIERISTDNETFDFGKLLNRIRSGFQTKIS